MIDPKREEIETSDKNDNLTDEDVLETKYQYKQRWISIKIIYFTMFVMSLGFSIVLTGIWPYLDKLDSKAGKEFTGYVVAANPLGQMLFSPLFGYWGNRLGSIRTPLLYSIGLFILASGVYSSLENIPSNVKYWMLTSRFLVGVSSANVAICRSYISAATRLNERTKAISMISLAQVLGFIVGPGLQSIVTPLGEKGYSFANGIFTFNMYTAAGWINIIMSIINMIFFLPSIFKEYNIATKEVMITQNKATQEEAWKSSKPDYFLAWILIAAFFVLVFNFVLLETLGTPLTMDQFAWSKNEALYYMGVLMSCGGIIACLSFVLIEPLCKKFKEQTILIWCGFFLMLIGRLLYIPWGDKLPKLADTQKNFTFNSSNINSSLGCPNTQEWCKYTPALTIPQFIVGYIFTSIGYPIAVTLIQTIFSKILGPRPQGVWMGLMTGSGCLSRVMGPIFVSYIYTRLGTYWTFAMTSLMMFISMIWLLSLRKRLTSPVYKIEEKDLNGSLPILMNKIERTNV